MEMNMDMRDVAFANLGADTLQDIKRLEEQLRAKTNKSIILLAYEETDSTTEPKDSSR
ncbi:MULTISPECIES: hypothetical protein [Alicyclobacillus]|uniref:Uncharacterized protein n=1 Tax=Alicyclobacillus acidoterrestris (strain ATCC 49025 / DSM 3922 / CIP 106132 / NCIMB 13137 / GD3B) TaxID=1356854 RepID=T0BEE2_ALIAG|nr:MULTISPECIES: hypothetical protein [Alicyclobacillus]EPZ42388.1 hypothetical protein N007_15220 [Alicyclobacillus acidoterrestris ATCC 49025]UNO50514.1 hypothetical protein K1I37_08670 [Alicyclobacillus acidoterrestris]